MNKSKLHLLTIVGARPQWIKAAALSNTIRSFNNDGDTIFEEIILNTGQHYDQNMSQLFIDQLNIPSPKYNLGINSKFHGEMTGLMLQSIEPILLKERPDYVLVYGDTNSTLAGSLAAAKYQMPVVHIEAGLRSYNRQMPEEINRVITDHISDILFCPTDTAKFNLKKEGITEGVYRVGDIMLDSFNMFKDVAERQSNILSELGLSDKTYSLATVHRQENTDNLTRLKDIFSAIDSLAAEKQRMVIPLHPRTKNAFNKIKHSVFDNPMVNFISPVGYLDMIILVSHAKAILTDSGGLQKEAFFAGIPCITLRDETEWTETIDSGWNFLAGSDPEAIIEAFNKAKTSGLINPPLDIYGNGNASQLILENLLIEQRNKRNQR